MTEIWTLVVVIEPSGCRIKTLKLMEALEKSISKFAFKFRWISLNFVIPHYLGHCTIFLHRVSDLQRII